MSELIKQLLMYTRAQDAAGTVGRARHHGLCCLRPVPWDGSESHGDGRRHQLGGEGQGVSGDTSLRMVVMQVKAMGSERVG